MSNLDSGAIGVIGILCLGNAALFCYLVTGVPRTLRWIREEHPGPGSDLWESAKLIALSVVAQSAALIVPITLFFAVQKA
ncbi:MAG: hypothetical protein EON52_01175 [Actinomycetales bacterium]|nr:MAG: hypothetical protein EON52_01175 [Actinomycetales bacterium]